MIIIQSKQVVLFFSLWCFLSKRYRKQTCYLCFYQLTETLIKVRENLKKLWKQSPAGSCSHSISCSSNFHSCFCSLRETRYILSFSTNKEIQLYTYTGVVALFPISLICTRFAWHSSSNSSNEFRMPNFSTMASH